MSTYNAPLDFRICGELEVELEHTGNAVGFKVNGFDKFFTVSINNGPFQIATDVRIGLTDELAKEFVAALRTYSKTESNVIKG